MPILVSQQGRLDEMAGGAGTAEAAADMRIGIDIFFISMAAERLGMHPQTLRKYERLGLIRPTRTIGSMRVYSRDEIERLRLIKHLVEEAGVNLAGVQRLLAIADVVRRMRTVAGSTGSSRTQVRRLTEELDRLGELLGV